MRTTPFISPSHHRRLASSAASPSGSTTSVSRPQRRVFCLLVHPSESRPTWLRCRRFLFPPGRRPPLSGSAPIFRTTVTDLAPVSIQRLQHSSVSQRMARCWLLRRLVYLQCLHCSARSRH